jgi:hypothetical protein
MGDYYPRTGGITDLRSQEIKGAWISDSGYVISLIPIGNQGLTSATDIDQPDAGPDLPNGRIRESSPTQGCHATAVDVPCLLIFGFPSLPRHSRRKAATNTAAVTITTAE